ncbi:MAG: hypothetical protein HY094_10490 [Candidatus Melainabacteria bacterium]|nr:hypothetical protein [Candidatus Melainabacteria bacterium]
MGISNLISSKITNFADARINRFKIHKQIAPLLRPNNIGINPDGAYNPGATIHRNNRFLLFPRITFGEKYPDSKFVSYVCLAEVKDGLFIKDLRTIDALSPNDRFTYGYEDARVTLIGRLNYLVATAYDGKTPQITLTLTKNFEEFDYKGIIGPRDFDDKDAFFHPEPIYINEKPKLMLYHRASETGNIQYVLVDSIEELLGNAGEAFWKQEIPVDAKGKITSTTNLDSKTILRTIPKTWEGGKLGGGAPPIKTPKGGLFIYHAVDDLGIYRGGMALLDAHEPWKVISRSPFPILEPTLEFEVAGLVENVVFPQGVVLKQDYTEPANPIVYVYYGAADKYVGVAKFRLNDALNYLSQFDKDGNFIETETTKQE